MDHFVIRCRLQKAEATSALNRWFCSEHYKSEIVNSDKLMEYYIKSGGADDFRGRFREAMADDNIWYCSQFYRRNERDPLTLWDYYMKYSPLVGLKLKSKYVPDRPKGGMNLAG